MTQAVQQALVLVCLMISGAAAHAASSAVALDRSPDKVATLSVPDQSREDTPSVVPVHGPWHIVQTVDGVRTWETTLPIRPRTLFFHRTPAGMKLNRIQDSGKPKRQKYSNEFRDADQPNTWAFSIHTLHVRRDVADGPPEPNEYRLRYPRAIEREKSFNRDTSKAPSDKSFVFRSVQVGDTNRHGLFLPAPSEISFDVVVPENSILRFDARIIPPEAAVPGQASDGASVLVSIDSGGGEIVIKRIPVTESLSTIRLDLAPFGGTTARLFVRTEPGQTALLDYVFLAEPTIYVPDENPPRTVIIFIDTLRPDHMSLYGYERETSPAIDEWGEKAAVFSQARSIAPWTLPSARTMLTGQQPERWKNAQRIQDLFADAGWATGFFAGNVYLSSNFEMANGWGEHRCVNWPQASVQVNRAIDYLDRNTDRSAFMLLHIMDMHLPYTEPLTYRYLYAGQTPEALKGDYFLRGSVSRAGRKMDDEDKQYVRDRYDNNMRYVDHHVSRILKQLDDNDTVVLVSDHGEEFWDHGGFEHGHSLYDELLRIPLAIRGPGIKAGQYTEPVSLLDVAPTLAASAGLSTEGMVGWDLRGLADGQRTAEFAARPHAFGRPLYGLRRWGSLLNEQKYMVEEGKERLFDLRVDPGETDNRIKGVDPEPWREAMSNALDRPVKQAWRLVPSRNNPSKPITAKLTMGGPLTAAWNGHDPTMHGKATVAVKQNTMTAKWPKQKSRVEVFLVPPEHTEDMAVPTLALTVGGKSKNFEVPYKATNDSGRPQRLLKAPLGGRNLLITSTVVPVPSDADGTIVGFDQEVAGDLESLGYVGD